MKDFSFFFVPILKSPPPLDLHGPRSTCGWLLKEWRDQFKKHIRLGSDLLPNQPKRHASLKFHEGKKKKHRSVSLILQEGGGSLVGGFKKENSSVMLTGIFYTGEVRGRRLCIYISAGCSLPPESLLSATWKKK